MPNMRVIYNNAADRATLTGTAPVGSSMALANLLTEIKSEVYRVTGTSASITATWTASETIGGVVLPFTNLTATATVRVRGYVSVGGTLAFDITANPACPGQAPQMFNWTDSGAGSNAFSYGGGMYARVWMATPMAVKQIIIDVTDTGNTAGYLEMARLVCGAYWEAQNPPVYGVPLETVDTSVMHRLGSGDGIADIKPKWRKQTIELQDLTNADRQTLFPLLRACGVTEPILISLYPSGSNAYLEQQHMIYGRLVDLSPIGTSTLNRYNSTLTQEEA